MEPIITGVNFEVTPSLRDLAVKKLQRVKHHFDHVVSAPQIIFRHEKLTYIAEINLKIPGNILHARAEADDAYKALDDMLSKLDRQLLKHKEKITNHHVTNIPPNGELEAE